MALNDLYISTYLLSGQTYEKDIIYFLVFFFRKESFKLQIVTNCDDMITSQKQIYIFIININLILYNNISLKYQVS